MKLSEMRSGREALDEQLADPEFAAEWQRTALGRAVAIQVVRYRAEYELSQSELARQLGMRQPQVARIEAGDHTPTIETLLRLAAGLGIEIAIDVRPAGRAAGLLSVDAAHTAETVDSGDAALSVVAVGRATGSEHAGDVRRIAPNSPPRPRRPPQTEHVFRSGYRAVRSAAKATKGSGLKRR